MFKLLKWKGKTIKETKKANLLFTGFKFILL